jgi:hypothetical protein
MKFGRGEVQKILYLIERLWVPYKQERRRFYVEM